MVNVECALRYFNDEQECMSSNTNWDKGHSPALVVVLLVWGWKGGWKGWSLPKLSLSHPLVYAWMIQNSSYLELDHTHATWKAQWRVVSSSIQLSGIDSDCTRTHLRGPRIFWWGMPPDPPRWSTLMRSLTHTPPATLAPPPLPQ